MELYITNFSIENVNDCVIEIDSIDIKTFQHFHSSISYFFSFNIVINKTYSAEMFVWLKTILQLYKSDIVEVCLIENLDFQVYNQTLKECFFQNNGNNSSTSWSGFLVTIKCRAVSVCKNLLCLLQYNSRFITDKISCQHDFNLQSSIATQIFLNNSTSYSNTVKTSCLVFENWTIVNSFVSAFVPQDYCTVPALYRFCLVNKTIRKLKNANHFFTKLPRMTIDIQHNSNTLSNVILQGLSVDETISSITVFFEFCEIKILYVFYVINSMLSEIHSQFKKKFIEKYNFKQERCFVLKSFATEKPLLEYFIKNYSEGFFFSNLGLCAQMPHILQGQLLHKHILPVIINRLKLWNLHSFYELYVTTNVNSKKCSSHKSLSNMYSLHKQAIILDSDDVSKFNIMLFRQNVFLESQLFSEKLAEKIKEYFNIDSLQKTFTVRDPNYFLSNIPTLENNILILNYICETISMEFCNNIYPSLLKNTARFSCSIEKIASYGPGTYLKTFLESFALGHMQFFGLENSTATPMTRIRNRRHFKNGLFNDNFSRSDLKSTIYEKINIGGFCLAIPGIYKNTFTLDFTHFYPSIIQQMKISKATVDIFSKFELEQINSCTVDVTLDCLLNKSILQIWLVGNFDKKIASSDALKNFNNDDLFFVKLTTNSPTFREDVYANVFEELPEKKYSNFIYGLWGCDHFAFSRKSQALFVAALGQYFVKKLADLIRILIFFELSEDELEKHLRFLKKQILFDLADKPLDYINTSKIYRDLNVIQIDTDSVTIALNDNFVISLEYCEILKNKINEFFLKQLLYSFLHVKVETCCSHKIVVEKKKYLYTSLMNNNFEFVGLGNVSQKIKKIFSDIFKIIVNTKPIYYIQLLLDIFSIFYAINPLDLFEIENKLKYYVILNLNSDRKVIYDLDNLHIDSPGSTQILRKNNTNISFFSELEFISYIDKNADCCVNLYNYLHKYIIDILKILKLSMSIEQQHIYFKKSFTFYEIFAAVYFLFADQNCLKFDINLKGEAKLWVKKIYSEEQQRSNLLESFKKIYLKDFAVQVIHNELGLSSIESIQKRNGFVSVLYFMS